MVNDLIQIYNYYKSRLSLQVRHWNPKCNFKKVLTFIGQNQKEINLLFYVQMNILNEGSNYV